MDIKLPQCLFCKDSASRRSYSINTSMPTCKNHYQLLNRVYRSAHRWYFTDAGIKLAHMKGVDKGIIMLYSEQSSTNNFEKGTRRRTGGTTSNASIYREVPSNHLSKGDSKGLQDVSRDIASLQQPLGAHVVETMGRTNVRERKDDPY